MMSKLNEKKKCVFCGEDSDFPIGICRECLKELSELLVKLEHKEYYPEEAGEN